MLALRKYPRNLFLAPLLVIGALSIILFPAACSGVFPAPVETALPSPIITASPTIIWFPATRTPSPFPTAALLPTQAGLPGLGQVLITDSFEDPSLWTASAAGTSSIVIERSRITLTASSKAIVLSLRQDLILTDFYAVITARLSLCRAADSYGLLIRAAGTADYYRFAVNCNGQVRPERVHNGQMVPLAEWLPSGDAPAGAPGEVRLGVWAAGSEMRFFLNDRHQVTVQDPVHPFGSIGVYVFPGGANEEIVSFSDLSISSVSYFPPTPSTAPTSTPRP